MNFSEVKVKEIKLKNYIKGDKIKLPGVYEYFVNII